MTSDELHSVSQTPRDVLITRVIDARATPADWLSLRDLAQRDGAVWNELASAQRDAAALGFAMDDRLAVAERVDVPAVALRGAGVDESWARRIPRLGWGIAALLALALVSQMVSNRGSAGTQQAGLGPTGASFKTPDDAMDAYLKIGRDSGQVVGELPQRYVLETRPAADGKGYEVLYVRQVLERRRVDDMYKVGADETGRPVLVPCSPALPATAGNPL